MVTNITFVLFPMSTPGTVGNQTVTCTDDDISVTTGTDGTVRLFIRDNSAALLLANALHLVVAANHQAERAEADADAETVRRVIRRNAPLEA